MCGCLLSSTLPVVSNTRMRVTRLTPRLLQGTERGVLPTAGSQRSEMSSGMPSQLFALCFDADEPRRLAQFWSGLLGWESTDDPGGGVVLLPSDDTGFRIRFLPTQERKLGQNRMHFDLTSTSLEEQQQTVAKALGLGAQHIDIGQLPEEGHVVISAPAVNDSLPIWPFNNSL